MIHVIFTSLIPDAKKKSNGKSSKKSRKGPFEKMNTSVERTF